MSQTSRTVAPIATLETQEVCSLRLRQGNFDRVMAELAVRGEFTDLELAQIRRARAAVGMGESAVHCAIGEPQQILTQAIGDDYDKAYRYDRVLTGIEMRVFFANGVVARIEEYPRATSVGAFP